TGGMGCASHPLSIEHERLRMQARQGAAINERFTMKLYTQLLLLFVFTAIALPATAQVDKVAIKTTGISCGTCAAVSEIYLKRLPAVDKVAISMKNEAVLVSYKTGASFQPKELRDILKK